MFDKLKAYFKRTHTPRKAKKRDAILDEVGDIFLVLNKPKIIHFSEGHMNEVTVQDMLPKNQELKVVGHHTDDDEGLVIFSSCDNLKDDLETEFVVKLDKPITPTFIKKMTSGVALLNKLRTPIYVEKIDQRHFRIVLVEELDDQVKKMIESLGYHAIRIMKVRIENIVIDKLRFNKWRYLSVDEIKQLTL